MVANPARSQLNRAKSVFPCPRLRLGIWSRETGSAVPSRVSLLTLHSQAESGAYSRDSSRFPRRRHSPFIYTVNCHRASPEFIRSNDCVLMALPAETPLAQLQRGQVTSAAFKASVVPKAFVFFQKARIQGLGDLLEMVPFFLTKDICCKI